MTSKRSFWPTSRGICLALAFVPLLGSLAAALQPRTASRIQPDDRKARPALVFLQYMTDLGNLDDSRDRDAAGFSFTNRSDFHVRITKITPSCGCLTTRIATQDYPPGTEGEFYIQIDTAGEMPGPKRFDAVVSYETRNPDGQTIAQFEEKVWFKLVVPQKKLIVEPAAVIIYQAASGEPTSRIVKLVDNRDVDLTILSAKSNHPQVFVNVIGRTAQPSPKLYEVEVLVQGTFPEKPVKALVEIETDDEAYRVVRVPMLIQGMPKESQEATQK